MASLGIEEVIIALNDIQRVRVSSSYEGGLLIS